MAADLLLPVLRHHAFVLGVIVIRGKVEPVLPHLEAELLAHRLDRAHALGHDLLADAVARNDGDTIDAVGIGHRAFSSGCSTIKRSADGAPASSGKSRG